MRRNLDDFSLNYKNITLRFLQENDVEKFVCWHTRELEWKKWDAPWEDINSDEDRIRERLKRILDRPKELLPGRLQICHSDGSYIGWVGNYLLNGHQNERAVGIDIPEKAYWGKGLGEQALKLWIAYIFNVEPNDYLFCQTWSGNLRMVRLAEKCGFEIIERKKDFRKVNGKFYDGLTFKLEKETFYRDNKDVIEEIKNITY